MRIINVTNTSNVNYDEGLRTYMVNVFKQMSIALCITGITSYIVANSLTLMKILFGTPLSIFVSFAPFIFVLYFQMKINTMSVEKAKNCLWAYSALMGLSLSAIFLVYTSVNITRAFLISASMFFGMSIYGNVTKKNLTSMAQFMIMGLFGVMIASIVNIFTRSVSFDYGLSILSVIIFTALTAFDVQRLKMSYEYFKGDSETVDKIAIFGALNLYMDFLNIFLNLLRILELNNNRRK